MNIDQYAYCSKLRKYEPILKLYFSIASIAIGLWSNQVIISIVLILIMGALTTIKGKLPIKVFIRLLTLPMVFLLLGVLGIAFSFGGKQEAYLYALPLFNGFVGFTRVGIHQAATLFLKALGATACMYFLILNTPMVDLLSAFKKLKLPKLLIEVMELMYRFILIFLNTADTIYIAQKSRLGYSHLKSSYHALGGLASALFIRSFIRSEELYRALEARGYVGELNVLEEGKTLYRRGYVWVTGFECGLVVLTLFINSL